MNVQSMCPQHQLPDAEHMDVMGHMLQLLSDLPLRTVMDKQVEQELLQLAELLQVWVVRGLSGTGCWWIDGPAQWRDSHPV